MSTPDFTKLSEEQTNTLKDLLQEFWNAFVADDEHLMDTKCRCCAEKRALVQAVLEGDSE